MSDKPDTHKPEGKERSRLLLVDDEPQILRTLQATLSTQGYEIRTAPNGLDGLILFREWKPDLVITDLSMPEMSGVELCREIRSIASTPIIVLSVREQEGAKVSALDAGADDYVTKPFNIQELKARVRAQLRRQDAIKVPLNESVLLGDFSINVEQHRVKVRGTDVHLTPKQFELLLYMAHHPGKVLSHRDLLNAVWGANAVAQPEYLRVAIGHLRKKLGEHGEQYLQTEPWVGYRFVPEPEPDPTEARTTPNPNNPASHPRDDLLCLCSCRCLFGCHPRRRSSFAFFAFSSLPFLVVIPEGDLRFSRPRPSPQKHVISTEAANSLTVRCTPEREPCISLTSKRPPSSYTL